VIVAGIQTFPLRVPFKPGIRSASSAWGPKDLAAVDSLLVKARPTRDTKAGGRLSDSRRSR
jgi:hypothetical protein